MKGAARTYRDFVMIDKLIGYRPNTRHRYPRLTLIPEPYTNLEFGLRIQAY